MSPVLGFAALLAFAPPPSGRAVRGNTAMHREHGAVFSLGAAPRLGVLVGGGADVMQRVGFGAGLQFRVHGLRVGPLRFGGQLQLGHTRYLQRHTFDHVKNDGTIQHAKRYAALDHTDFTAGPSVQIVAGPVLFELGFGAGLGISSFVRPQGVYQTDEHQYQSVSAMIRGGGQLVVPIRNNHGVMVGAAVQKFFSKKKIAIDPTAPAPAPQTNPFDMMVEIFVGYHYMF